MNPEANYTIFDQGLKKQNYFIKEETQRTNFMVIFEE